MQYPPLDLFNLTCPELAAALQERYGKGVFHAQGLFRALFQNGDLTCRDIPEFASATDVLEQIRTTAVFPAGTISEQVNDGVQKLLIDLHDGNAIESVIIPGKNRRTLCISSQAGCAMGCVFCATGALGFSRNLLAREIVHQLFLARFTCGCEIRNIVFMGMGEPLENVHEVIRAVRVISDPRGFNIAPRYMTISTAGHVDGLETLAREQFQNLRIAVSLNAPEDALRDRIMPINRRYPLAILKDALRRFPLGKNGLFLIEYVLIQGVNDSPAMAEALIRWVEGLPVRINLISCNPTGSSLCSGPDALTVERFNKVLVAAGLFVRIRQSPGRTIAAACGQLTASFKGA